MMMCTHVWLMQLYTYEMHVVVSVSIIFRMPSKNAEIGWNRELPHVKGDLCCYLLLKMWAGAGPGCGRGAGKSSTRAANQTPGLEVRRRVLFGGWVQIFLMASFAQLQWIDGSWSWLTKIAFFLFPRFAIGLGAPSEETWEWFFRNSAQIRQDCEMLTVPIRGFLCPVRKPCKPWETFPGSWDWCCTNRVQLQVVQILGLKHCFAPRCLRSFCIIINYNKLLGL